MTNGEKLMEAALQLLKLESEAASGTDEFKIFVKEMGDNLVRAVSHVGKRYVEALGGEEPGT